MGQTKHILTGRCLCGSIRYETAAPVSPPAFCHCESCRRATGAHVVAWMTVDRQALRWLGHEPRWHASSPGVVRGFCTGCGTPLTYRHDSYGERIDLTIATLDDPAPFAPVDHIWMADAVDWDHPADGLPQYPGLRPARGAPD